MKAPFKISPIVRLSLALDQEMKLDKAGVLAGLREKYTARLAVAEQKRDNLFRSVFYLDAVLAFLITGQSFKLPFFDITTTQIPAVVEATTLACSIGLMIGVVHFITWAAYDAILRQYAIVEARTEAIDPDFINAAESHVELAIKLLRAKFNIWGPDFHEPGERFKVYSVVVFGLITLLFILFPIVHGLLIGMSITATYLAHGLSIVSGLYFLIVIVLHLVALLIAGGAYKRFTFFVDFSKSGREV